MRNHTEFLEEAIVYARAGAVCLLLDTPLVRPGVAEVSICRQNCDGRPDSGWSLDDQDRAVIPDDGLWLHTPEARTLLDRALDWSVSHPRSETDLKGVARKIGRQR